METHAASSVNHQIPQQTPSENKKFLEKIRTLLDPVGTVNNSYSFRVTENFVIAWLFAHPFYFVNYTYTHVCGGRTEARQIIFTFRCYHIKLH